MVINLIEAKQNSASPKILTARVFKTKMKMIINVIHTAG